MSGTIFSACTISAISALPNNVEKDAGRNRRRKNYGKVKTDVEPGFEDCSKFAEHMLLDLSESGHPVFCGTGALDRGTLRNKETGKLSTHFCGDPQTVEVILRTIISVNQLSVYGAVADMCEELASRISDCSANTVKLVADDKPETMVAPTDLSTTTNPLLTNDQSL